MAGGVVAQSAVRSVGGGDGKEEMITRLMCTMGKQTTAVPTAKTMTAPLGQMVNGEVAAARRN